MCFLHEAASTRTKRAIWVVCDILTVHKTIEKSTSEDSKSNDEWVNTRGGKKTKLLILIFISDIFLWNFVGWCGVCMYVRVSTTDLWGFGDVRVRLFGCVL